MAFDVKLLPRAECDINEIAAYKAQFYPSSVNHFLDALEHDLNALAENPRICPVYEYDKRFRKLVVKEHLVFYTIDEKNEHLNVYRILHGKRDIINIITGMCL